MASLRWLYRLHCEPAGPLIPLWDKWMPMAPRWPVVSSEASRGTRVRWAQALAGRGMSSDGYVHTHQHDGLAHAEGWPFPLWTQAGGVGCHFRGTGIAGYDGPPATPEGWRVSGAKGGEVNDRGWVLELAEPRASAQTPPFAIDARIAPWLRLNWWANGLAGASSYVEWTTKDDPEFAPPAPRVCLAGPGGVRGALKARHRRREQASRRGAGLSESLTTARAAWLVNATI